MHGEDLLSEMGSVCSSEVSTLVDENFSEWPFVQIRDCHPQHLTSRQLSVTENFIAELKPCSPVPHGLLRVNCDNNCALLSVGPTDLMRSCVNANGYHSSDNIVDCAVPQKRKEISVSSVKSCVCNTEEIRNFHKVVGGCAADKIEADDSQLSRENESHDTSVSESTDESGHTGDRERQTVLFRCVVEPEFSTVWLEDEACCRTRLDVCRRELVRCGDVMSSHNKGSDTCTKADKPVAVELHQQLTSTASSETFSQMTAVSADDEGSATVESEKKVCVVNYEPCDIEKRVPEIVRDTGRSHAAEELSKDNHSSHSVNSRSLWTIQTMKSSSDQSTGICRFSNELHMSEECIYKRSKICRRDPTTAKCSYEQLAGDAVVVMIHSEMAEVSDNEPTEHRSVQDDATDLGRTTAPVDVEGEDKTVRELNNTVYSRGLLYKLKNVKVDEVLSYDTCSRIVADTDTEVKGNDVDIFADKSPKALAVFGSRDLGVAGRDNSLFPELAVIRFAGTVNVDSSVEAGAIRDESESTDRLIDSVADTAVDSSVRTLVARDDVSAEMLSDIVAVPGDCTHSSTEIPFLSVSAPNDFRKSDSEVVVMATSVVDPPQAQVDILARESGITVCDHTYRKTEPCEEEIFAENFHKPVTIIRSCSDETADITDDGDVQFGITSQEEYVQTVSSGDSLPHIPIRSREEHTVPCSSTSISSQTLDLMESLVDSISQSPTGSFIDRCKADKLQTTTPALHQVNSELDNGSASVVTSVLLAHMLTADDLDGFTVQSACKLFRVYWTL